MSDFKFQEGDFVKHKLNKEIFIVIGRKYLDLIDRKYVCRNKQRNNDWQCEEFYEYELEKRNLKKSS